MIVEFRQKGQITIPKDIVKQLGIKEGDKLNVTEQNGAIHMVPVVVCSADSIQALQQEICDLKAKLQSGKELELEQLEVMLKSVGEITG